VPTLIEWTKESKWCQKTLGILGKYFFLSNADVEGIIIGK